MDKITKAHYRFIRQTLESKDKDTQSGIRRILRERAKYIKLHKSLAATHVKSHVESTIFGLQLALSELGIDIKRYGS